MIKFLLLTIAMLFIVPAWAEDKKKPPAPTTPEHRIGVMVLEIQAALKAPNDKKSLETIARYGTDTRYYVMIRGWLVQLLNGAESQLNATRDPDLKKKHQTKVTFLRKAIRRIDLE